MKQYSPQLPRSHYEVGETIRFTSKNLHTGYTNEMVGRVLSNDKSIKSMKYIEILTGDEIKKYITNWK